MEPRGLRPRRRCCRWSSSWPNAWRASTASACGRCAACTCAASSTASPRSTTRPGRRTGTSCRTPRRTSTRSRRSCSSCSTSTGRAWPSASTRARWSAAALTFPDINQVLARMNGRLLPLGWWHFLRKGRTIDRVRVGFLGVKPEYQHTGVAAKLYLEHFKAASERPQSGGEMGWILETNTADEPRHGSDGGTDRQALPRVRADARRGLRVCPLDFAGVSFQLEPRRRRRGPDPQDGTDGEFEVVDAVPVVGARLAARRGRAASASATPATLRRGGPGGAGGRGGRRRVRGRSGPVLARAAPPASGAGRAPARRRARSARRRPPGRRSPLGPRWTSYRSSPAARCWSTSTCSPARAAER